MKHFVIVIFCFCYLKSSAQDSLHKLRISVLTCAPGGELYATFGHTALRVTDSVQHTDIIYNYGTFDFDDPNFYSKFVRGKLDYFLSTEDPSSFIQSYQLEGRSIWEQVLNLTVQQKQQIQDYLNDNLAGDKKYYKYDFLFDNCTSRVKDILKKNAGLNASAFVTAPTVTFRNLLHGYLDKSGMCWSKLGIDILLGSKIDRPATAEETNFLPELLMKTIDVNKQIVSSTKYLYQATEVKQSSNKYLPLIVFGIVALVFIGLSFSTNSIALIVAKTVFSLLLYITGVLGFLLLFMWFGTDHKSCAANYNLLWALPTNFFAAFFVFKQKAIAKKYFKVAFWIQFLLLLSWAWLPQQLNINVIPVVALMLFIYWYCGHNKK